MLNNLLKIIFVFLLCHSVLFSQTINIAISANLSHVAKKLKSEFMKSNSDIKIQIIIGSSGKLYAQINHNAPYDVFMSADMLYPKALFDANKTCAKPQIYAYGLLALLSNKYKNININSLTTKIIKQIAIANPKIAPYGKAAYEVLKSKKLLNKIDNKLIYSESIAQTLFYTIYALDAGFVSKSLLLTPKMQKKYKKDIDWIEINHELYNPIKQGIVVLKNSKYKKEALKFYNFIFTTQAQNIFKKYGYAI